MAFSCIGQHFYIAHVLSAGNHKARLPQRTPSMRDKQLIKTERRARDPSA